MLIEDFIRRKLPDYVRSAFSAKFLRKNDSYILVKGKASEDVTVVDKGTGVEQPNMRWTNGLHQFLQLQYTQRIVPEGLKAVYMSNVAFFLKYGANVVGLTGFSTSQRMAVCLDRCFRRYSFKQQREKW